VRSSSHCPICNSESLATVTERPNVPVHQHILYDTADAARNAVRGHLHIVACLVCGFVFNASFDLSLMSYGVDYENDQTHSPAFSAHVDQLAKRLLNESGVRDSRVVEVGCGKGNFLRALVESPSSGNIGWGFDPSYRGPDSDMDDRAQFVRSFYSADSADVSPDVVVCRHVIEHVPDPVTLLSQISSASAGARVFLETPDVEWILRNNVIWDFFYEHCSYFSRQSFAAAFRRTGFGDASISTVFGDQYLWVEATSEEPSRRKPPANPGEIGPLVESYGRAEGENLSSWKETIASLRDKGAVALWGAGAKGVTSAGLFDPEAQLISCVVDLNPAKQGRFLSVTGHPIVSPSELQTRAVASVILLNQNYLSEVRQLLAHDHADVRVIVAPNRK
jgi:SAM-dependent methyltransferase